MKLKKAGSIIFALIILLLPTMVFASSYWSTLHFSTNLKGSTRYYNGNDMHITLTATCLCQNANVPQTFTVKLYRDRFLFDYYIGRSTFKRNGYNSATWTNVGEGNYYFYFSKANDGYWVDSSNVHMYN